MSLAPRPIYPTINAQSPGFLASNQRVEELNSRIQGRNEADQMLESNFSPRPVPTKYTHFSVIDARPLSTVPIQSTPTYSVGSVFNPGTRGPSSGYFSNIENENTLKFQQQIRTRNDNGVYVPSSNSDLFKTVIQYPEVQQPFPLLFSQEKNWRDTTGSFVEQFPTIGCMLLNNSTRAQLRGVGKPTVSPTTPSLY
jgi:hypothetical protein